MELRREARFHHFPTTIFLFAIVFGFIFRIGVLLRMSVRFFLLTKVYAMELLSTFRYKSFKVETYFKGVRHLHVKVYLKDKLIFEDGNYKPSPLYSVDDTETMVSLLDFLMAQYGDTDQEYFEKRSCPDLDEYANESNEAGEIRMMLYDYEMRDDKEALKENEITRSQAMRIERYIKNE